MFENGEIVNTPEIEARIKIEELENELKLSKEEVIQCEKDKKDLISVIEKLQEKFVNKQLDGMIGKLESNVVLLDKAVENAKRNACKDNSTNSRVNNGNIVDDRQHTESASNSVTDLLTKVSEALCNIRNDDLSSSSSDDENNTDSEQSDDSETDVRSSDVFEKLTVSLNRLQNWVDQMRNSADKDRTRSDPSMKNTLKCDEVFMISDEDDSVQFDFQSVSHSKAPAVIELTDSEDCLLLSETSDNENAEKTNQPQRNDFSGIFKKTPRVEKDSPDQSDVRIDVPCGESSNSVSSKTNRQQQKFSDVRQKSTTPESGDLSAEVGKKQELLPSDCVKKEVLPTIRQEGKPFNVLLKPVLSESDVFSSLADENNSPRNDSSNKVSFSKTNQNSKQPSDFKLDASSIPVDEEDILLQTDDSNDVIFSKTSPKGISSCRASQNRILIRSDLSTSFTPVHEDNLLQNRHSNEATYQKGNHDKISIPEDEEDILLQSDDSINAVYPKINVKEKSTFDTSQHLARLVKSDVSLTPVRKDDKILKNNLSSESTYPKSNHENISFSGIFQKTAGVKFGDSSTRMSTNAELSLDKSIKATCTKIKQEVDVRTEFDDSSTQIGAEVNLLQNGKLDDDMLASTSRKNISSVEVSRKSPVVDYSSGSSTQSCEIVELFNRKDLPRNSICSKLSGQGKSSSHVLKRTDSCEFDSSLTPPIPHDDLLGCDDSNEATDFKMVEQTKSFLGLLKRQMPDVEQDAKYEMDARKRFKYELYASYSSSRSSSLRSSPSIASFEEMRKRNRLPIWPCPVCEECFGDAFHLSRHLNDRHFGEEGVCSCSICGFVTPSVNAHKRHVNKYHGNAFLLDNRVQFLNEEHAYATKGNSS